jgi:shikimate dehydrogenase
MADEPRRVAVIGHPIAHSRSPRMHAAAFAALGLNWRYDAIDVPPEALDGFLEGLPASGLVGVNVTIPHKQAVLGRCAELAPEAQAAGSVNTLLVRPDGGLAGHSTDGRGLLWAIRDVPVGEALVLGAGGAARAAAAALADAGWRVAVSARREQAAAELGLPVVGWPPAELPYLVVNATPVGQSGDLALLPVDAAQLRPGMTVCDLAYRADGEPTALVLAAARAGARVVHGLQVLVGQGALAFELFTGLPAPIDVMQAAVRA